MTGARAEKLISLPNRKTMMMKLKLSRLKNIMKIKVMKKENNSPVIKLKN